jgi:hypothetical protein
VHVEFGFELCALGTTFEDIHWLIGAGGIGPLPNAVVGTALVRMKFKILDKHFSVSLKNTVFEGIEYSKLADSLFVKSCCLLGRGGVCTTSITSL